MLFKMYWQLPSRLRWPVLFPATTTNTRTGDKIRTCNAVAANHSPFLEAIRFHFGTPVKTSQLIVDTMPGILNRTLKIKSLQRPQMVCDPIKAITLHPSFCDHWYLCQYKLYKKF